MRRTLALLATVCAGVVAAAAGAAEPLHGTLVFHSDRTGDLELYLANADGSDGTQHTSQPGTDAFADWSPNGKQIGFQHTPGPGASFELYTMEVETGEKTQLTS